jgi:hypothetical protein
LSCLGSDILHRITSFLDQPLLCCYTKERQLCLPWTYCYQAVDKKLSDDWETMKFILSHHGTYIGDYLIEFEYHDRINLIISYLDKSFKLSNVNLNTFNNLLLLIKGEFFVKVGIMGHKFSFAESLYLINKNDYFIYPEKLYIGCSLQGLMDKNGYNFNIEEITKMPLNQTGCSYYKTMAEVIVRNYENSALSREILKIFDQITPAKKGKSQSLVMNNLLLNINQLLYNESFSPKITRLLKLNNKPIYKKLDYYYRDKKMMKIQKMFNKAKTLNIPYCTVRALKIEWHLQLKSLDPAHNDTLYIVGKLSWLLPILNKANNSTDDEHIIYLRTYNELLKKKTDIEDYSAAYDMFMADFPDTNVDDLFRTIRFTLGKNTPLPALLDKRKVILTAEHRIDKKKRRYAVISTQNRDLFKKKREIEKKKDMADTIAKYKQLDEEDNLKNAMLFEPTKPPSAVTHDTVKEYLNRTYALTLVRQQGIINSCHFLMTYPNPNEKLLDIITHTQRCRVVSDTDENENAKTFDLTDYLFSKAFDDYQKLKTILKMQGSSTKAPQVVIPPPFVPYDPKFDFGYMKSQTIYDSDNEEVFLSDSESFDAMYNYSDDE